MVLSAKEVSWIDDSLYSEASASLAVTGKWFLSYVSFGSIPGIAVNDYTKQKKKK
jgi:hypothetical protein|nr:MAG TPA: hypothetical protein [Caudoviricetes sp.]